MLSATEKRKACRIVEVFLGILAGQLILYGASFAGTKILLPLDILTRPGIYIPSKAGESAQTNDSRHVYLSDPVFEDEPARLFRHAELQAGRLPIWNPYQYAGVPSVSFLSPFAIFAALVKSPRILPWLSLLLALVSGFGTYLFSRRVLNLSTWPATIAAWCYPVTGFFVFWQSASLPHPIVWLPWLLYTTHGVLSRPGRWSLAGLALTTMLTLVSGHLDMAGLVLIVGGLFALWDFSLLIRHQDVERAGFRRLAVVVAGWALGFMLASPELLPAIEYAKTGSRVARRGAGQEERPPIGLVSLPQFLLPDVYGTAQRDSYSLLPARERNLVESPAAGFTGLLALLVIAPLAWGSRRHRSVAFFLAGIALLGMAWCLNLPGVVQAMRIPPLNMLSYNRFVFASSFAILILTAIGLEEISKGTFRWRKWYYVPAGILIGIATWCIFRAFVLPETISVTLPEKIGAGGAIQWVQDMDGVHRVQHWFVKMYLSGALVCVVGISFWVYLRFMRNVPRFLPLVLGIFAFCELLYFGYGRAAQSNPKLYYPPLPVLDAIAHSPAGRVLGHSCLPANLLQIYGLPDVRGYDGVDPARYVDLLDLAAAPNTIKFDYTAVQFFIPRIADGPLPRTVRLPPVLDLLGVRYLVIPDQADTEYYVFVNDFALPRVFVPQSIEVEADRESRLAKLASPSFDPRKVAYVEEPPGLTGTGPGNATLVESTSHRIVVRAKMDQPGLVVLADQWNSGWRASIGEKVLPIFRVDHALRGVVAPAGESTIVFRYQAASLRLGMAAAGLAILILAGACLYHPGRKA